MWIGVVIIMDYEIKANNYNIICMKITLSIICGVLLFNELGIFTMDKYLARISVISAALILLITIIVFKYMGVDKYWVKYVLIFIEILAIAILCVFMTYHAVLSIALPFLMAGHYEKKKMVWYTYALSVVGIIVIVLLGYQVGICDMNMVALTRSTVWDYGESVLIKINKLSLPYMGKLLLFFALPKVVMLYTYARLAISISEDGCELQRYMVKAEYESKHDKMTGLFNQNEYLENIETDYSKIGQIGVIFFDINGLKDINDKYGHEQGDILICTVADSIKYILDEKSKAYRIGGDEFIIIVKEAKEEVVKKKVNSWKKIIEIMNKNATGCICEVAIGYASGSGDNLKDVIEKADKKMYENKKNREKSKIIENKM